jgi:hypothetical protein
MKRLFVLGSLLAIAACAPQPPPPVATAPPPAPQVATMPPPAPPPPPTPPPAGRTGTSFDGAYTGSMAQSASGLSTQTGNTSPACVEERPATMTIRNGNVYIRYRDWKRHTINYRGKVNASGWVDAYHKNSDGSSSILSGQISNNELTANMERGPCDYTATLAKT